MNKLFIIQNNHGIYADELRRAFEIVENRKSSLKLEALSIDYLIDNSIDVVIANGLPAEWYYIFRGLNIVSIIFDDRKKYQQYSDIVIDCQSNDDLRYFTGDACAIRNNGDSAIFSINEIVNLITLQKWDSTFFGFNVAYLSCMHLTENIVFRTEQFIKKEKVRLVQYLCNCHDRESVRIAERNNYSFVDIRLTYSREFIPGETFPVSDQKFGKAKPDNIPRLQALSRELYAGSRYFFDGNFDTDKIYEFYQGWVEKGVLGQFDDECWCLYEDATPVAFCTVKYESRGVAVIGLVGVDKEYQGRGLGKALLYKVFNILTEKKINKIYVVTQGRNYSAQRLYQCVGFRTHLTQLWYHKWI